MVPDDFMISNAYPNPFNPTTTFNFDVPRDSKVRIEVYNLQGANVATLTNRDYNPGYHSVTWNANSYASGVYFVRMLSGSYVNTQKVMLIK